MNRAISFLAINWAAMASTHARINLDQPRYDQKTYTGRFLHMLTITSPTTLVKSDADLHAAVELLARYKRGEADEVPERQLWAAKQLRDAALHPQTGEKIPLVARMSAFMPMNILICYGLMLPNPSIPVTLFWQWSAEGGGWRCALRASHRCGRLPLP